MDIKDLEQKSQDELSSLLVKEQDNLRVLKFRAAGGHLNKVREIRRARKTIARIVTLLSK